MKKAVVTRSDGFAGGALTALLKDRGIEVLELNSAEELWGTSAISQGDMEILPAVLGKEPDWDVFYHFGWRGSSGARRSDPWVQLDNVKNLIQCVKAAKALGCRKFIGAGSIMEKEAVSLMDCRGSRMGAGHIYSTAKLAAHGMGTCTAAAEGIDFIWAYITNAYGPGERSTRFLNQTLRKIINDEPLSFTSGEQIYDFIYISDLAEIFYLLGLHGKPFTAYVAGSGRAKPLKEYILEIRKTLAPDREFSLGGVPYDGARLSAEDFNISRLVEDTGFKPLVSFSQGIEETISWLREEKERETAKGEVDCE